MGLTWKPLMTRQNYSVTLVCQIPLLSLRLHYSCGNNVKAFSSLRQEPAFQLCQRSSRDAPWRRLFLPVRSTSASMFKSISVKISLK